MSIKWYQIHDLYNWIKIYKINVFILGIYFNSAIEKV